ncbi:sulfite exporter TauE/SafE family protein, partial [Citrobacter werkmanii]|nr:sulfite exporter TauE/SafE family protein [Citrobacter werkmanii]
MNDLMIIALAGFTTGMTTVLFGFGGGFVVV